MFEIAGESQFELRVNGIDMLVGSGTLHELSIIENASATAPSMTVRFLDNKRAATGFGLYQDGAPISVTIGDGQGQQATYNYNQWQLLDATSNTAGELVTLNGIANIAPWTSKVVSKAYKGNASDVAQQLAKIGGISLADISPTQDKQTWLPDGRSIAQFVRKMIDHAWMGESATPHVVVTNQAGQWMLRVKDIMQSGGSTQSFASIGLPAGNAIPIWEYRVNSHGGPLNSYHDYGSKVVQERLSGNVDVWKDFRISKNVSFLGVSSALQGALNLVRTHYHPPDVGNTHVNYAKAFHNNRMGRASYSTQVDILTRKMSSVKLLDDVTIQLAGSDGSVDQAYSGTYKVAAVARTIISGVYGEKLQLLSQGTSASAAGGSL